MWERGVGPEDTDGDGEIEAGALFFQVGRREVDGDAGGGDVEAAVADGGENAVAAFPDRGVGQADGREDHLVVDGAGVVDLDIDEVRVDAIDGGAACFEEHGCT